ncbi:MAG TPA: GAF domain-containing protein, partial [Polyangiales bacterium]|nr:GAF domain-containing protein [Polyangiales bacterium]
GVLLENHERDDAFGPSEVRLLETIASSMSVALQNAKSYEAECQRAAELGLINTIQRALAGELSLQGVYDAVGMKLREVFPDFGVAIRRYDARTGLMHFPFWWQEAERTWDLAAEPPLGFGAEVLRSKRTLLIDHDAEEAARRFGSLPAPGGHLHRSQVIVPMFAGQQVVGMIDLNHRERERAFTEGDVRLLETIAASMSVALENARLFDETQQALEQQRASAEVLTAIGNSVVDTAPVFHTILDACERLFGTDQLAIFVVDGQERVHTKAWRGSVADGLDHSEPVALADSITGRVIRADAPLHVPDLLAMPGLAQRDADRFRIVGNVSVVYMPMRLRGKGIGSLCVMRQPPRPFTDRELGLLSMFADQAAIAVQNARLFEETQEALERQTATAEVLRVISESPTDVGPVFQVIAERARELCGAVYGGAARFENGMVHMAGMSGVDPERASAMRAMYPMAVEATAPNIRRALLDRASSQIPDIYLDPEYIRSFERMGIDPAPPPVTADTSEHPIRSILSVPLLYEGQAIGTIGVGRWEPGGFSAAQVELLETFARQAVIAIENVRLFNETKEALEQQT